MLLDLEVIGKRRTFGLAAVLELEVDSAETPPVPAARASLAHEPIATKLHIIAATVRTCKTTNLFRRPAGLADGLALKEPALLAITAGFAPTTWVPRSSTPGQGLGVFAGTLAK